MKHRIKTNVPKTPKLRIILILLGVILIGVIIWSLVTNGGRGTKTVHDGSSTDNQGNGKKAYFSNSLVCGTTSTHDDAGKEKECSPGPPLPEPFGTEGNGKATMSTYKGDSEGACGGCGAPGGYGNKFSFACMATDLLNARPKTEEGEVMEGIWFGTAPAESMATPFLQEEGSVCGNGVEAKDSTTTASAPCGSSFQLTNKKFKVKVNLVVVDACPNSITNTWCPKTPGTKNIPPEWWPKDSTGSYNHFDLYIGDLDEETIESKLGVGSGAITSDGPDENTFKPIETPPEIMKILQSYCCNAYWTGQGCPNICGKGFDVDGKSNNEQ